MIDNPLRVGSTSSAPVVQTGDGGSSPTSTLQFVIKRSDHATCKPFIEKWHYSRCVPRGKNIFFALYHGDEIYAVILYGWGVNPYQARFLKVDRVFELKRMCRSEPRLDGFPLSRLIAISLRMLRATEDPQCIVAFSDPEQGHEGIVYKGAGFLRHGETNAEWHVVGKDGIMKHRRVAYRYSKRKGCTIAQAREALGLTRVQTLPKIRWVKYIT